MSETIGQRLRQAREKRNLPLEQVSGLTRIRLHYLQALEADDYSLIPSAAQARGFLRNYAEFLNLDLGQALADLRSHPQPTEDVSGPLTKVEITPDAPRTALPPVEAEPVTRSSWLSRLRKAPAAPADSSSQSEAELNNPDSAAGPLEPSQTDGVSTEAIPAAGPAVLKDEEKKVEAESPPETGDQPEVQVEAQGPGLWPRLISQFRLRIGKEEETSVPVETDSDSGTAGIPIAASALMIEKPEEIFAEIGMKLHKRRELLSLTLDEVERHIRVRAVFVKALEEGAFDKLPSAVQTRGMLANYATFLDLNTEAILLRFADAIQAGHRLRYPEKSSGSKSPMRVSPNLPPWRSFIAGDLIFGVGMAALLVTMAVWGVNRVFSIQAEQSALPTAPSISDVLATSQQPTVEQQVTLIPAADTPLPADLEIIAPDAGLEAPAFDVTISVQVMITVVERTFLRVTVDGEEALTGRVLSNATYTYEASESIEVLTGNAAALRITYNGRDLGLMGNFGEVANRIYTADGVVTPTPVAPATSTPSLTPTASPTPSAIPKSPSPTPGGG